MSKIVLYYSFTGNAKKYAELYSRANNLKLCEVEPALKISKLKAYTVGCFMSIKGRPMPIKPLAADVSAYDEAEVFAPVWAGGIAPPMIAALSHLAKGTKVSLHLVAMAPEDKRSKCAAQLADMGIELAACEVIKART